MEKQSNDVNSVDYQRLQWDQLRKSINGLINKVNTSNIKVLAPQLFQLNLIRGRGLFVRSILRAQSSSLPFTPVFAALVSIINSKLPQVGELLIHRLINQFRKSYRRNDKHTCNASVMFLAHLINQSVLSDVFALELALFLLSKGGDDGVEIAVQFMREVGQALQEREPSTNHLIYDELRNVLHDGDISKRVQFMIEVLFQIRKDKFKHNPIIPPDLDLIEEDEQIVHDIDFNGDLDVQESTNIFKFDENYNENEEKYKSIRYQILGSSDEEDESEEEESEEEEDNEQEGDQGGIIDKTSTNLVNLRRTIYLTIMNSLVFDEAVHKLMRIQIPQGQEIELCNMIVECCSQERTYNKFYGLIGERFAKLNKFWQERFQICFNNFYDTIHRYETNRLRNIARFFGHLLSSDAIDWKVFSIVKMNQDDTTSSSRIFIKILITEIVEILGLNDVKHRFSDRSLSEYYKGMFPMDHPANARFSINYFTAIGFGALTEDMREYLKNAPKMLMEQRTKQIEAENSSDSDDSSVLSSSSSDVSSLSSSSRSPSRSPRSRSLSRTPPRRFKGGRDSRSPPPRRFRDSISRSPPPRRFRDSRSPPRYYNGRRDSYSPPPRRYDSRSPPYRRNYSRSPSPPPRRYRDYSPLRRVRRDSVSRSPPRRYRDDSPPRRIKRESMSISPPRRYRDDYSPPRRVKRESLSRSPPPKHYRDDYSPPRRIKRESISRSPPRRYRRDSYR